MTTELSTLKKITKTVALSLPVIAAAAFTSGTYASNSEVKVSYNEFGNIPSKVLALSADTNKVDNSIVSYEQFGLIKAEQSASINSASKTKQETIVSYSEFGTITQ